MILVTGGAGFIGSNIVAALAERGMPVAICDRLRTNDKWRNVAKADFRELVAPESLDAWLSGRGRLEAVVHMGAISATTERDADLIYDVNVRLSTRLWEWCAASGTPFIYASSAATYGAGESGFDDDDRPEALARLRPLNAYGWSKHFFDRRVRRAVDAREPAPPQWVGLKFFNVYGPNEYHKSTMQSVVAQKYPRVAAGEALTLFTSHHPDYPDGGQMRDFVFVEDCVEVILWLLARPGLSGLYNLGSGEARSFADLGRAIAAAAGVPSRIEFVPMPEAIRPNYQYYTCANMRKLREAGYDRPLTSIEDGVRRYVQHYLAGPDRYR
ncbi:MAG TPA: ADP-glyceromanno-heptose 6-epimerase [Steroidobacteraceae bacterium]|nr:ADP-glyceromanno-heptose 6-epimerase [Steroidobacteraceae bacterium]